MNGSNRPSAPSWTVRPHEDADLLESVAIWNRVEPHHRTTPEEYTRNVELLRGAGRLYQCRVATDPTTGRIGGLGAYYHDPDAFDPDRYWIEVEVDPSVRRKGAGEALYAAIESELLARGARQLRVGTDEAVEAGTAFARKHGFTELRRRWRSLLDVASADLSSLPERRRRLAEAGVTLTTLGEEGAEDPDVLRRLYELDTEITYDEPRSDPMTPLTQAVWEQYNVRLPGQTTADFQIARRAGEYVGLSYGRPLQGEPGVFQQAFTGVRRAARGLGVATALKLALIEVVRKEGYPRLQTSNDSRNARMWGINQRLGFVRTETRILWGRDVPPTGSH